MSGRTRDGVDRRRGRPGRGERGTVLPLVLLGFLLAGLLVAAATAASAAFLAQRDLTGVCDGAALAGAAALDRAALGRVRPDGAALGRTRPDRAAPGRAGPGGAARGSAGPDGAAPGPDGTGPAGAAAGLPVDAAGVAAAVEDYRRRADRPGLDLAAATDGSTVTVVCRRTVRVPFGAVLGAAEGLDRTAVARARTALLPPR